MSGKDISLTIWITNKCNYKCSYCYEAGILRGEDMSIVTADKIIDYLIKNTSNEDNLYINFLGGEPTLNFSVIKYIVRNIEGKLKVNNVKYTVTTNGSILDTEMINFFSDYFYQVSISVDGDRTIQELNRVSIDNIDYYDRIIFNAISLLNKNIDIRIRMTIERNSINAIYRNILYFMKLGFKNIIPVANYYNKKWTTEDFELMKIQFKQIKDYLIIHGISDVTIYPISNEFNTLSRCRIGERKFSIDPKGNIYPCNTVVGYDEFAIGNIYEGFNHKKIKELNDINNKIVEECEDCMLYDYCTSTRCLIINYVTMGEFYKPNLVNCNILNIKHSLL